MNQPFQHADTVKTVAAEYPLPTEVPPPDGYPTTGTSVSWHGPVSRHGKQRKQRQQSQHDIDTVIDKDDVTAHGVRHAQAVSLPSHRLHASLESKQNHNAFLGVLRYPFPGNESSKRLRRLFWAALFCFVLLKNMQEGFAKRRVAVRRLETMIWNARACLQQLLLSDDVPVMSIILSVTSKDAKRFLVKSRGIFRRATGDDTAALRALSSTTEQLLDEVIRITVSTVCR